MLQVALNYPTDRRSRKMHLHEEQNWLSKQMHCNGFQFVPSLICNVKGVNESFHIQLWTKERTSSSIMNMPFVSGYVKIIVLLIVILVTKTSLCSSFLKPAYLAANIKRGCFVPDSSIQLTSNSGQSQSITTCALLASKKEPEPQAFR